MANPVPEIMPDEARQAGAAIVATGRSDFANQINNSLAFPGIFRGALDNRVTKITDEHKIAAAEAIAGLVEKPSADCIIPGPFTDGLVEKNRGRDRLSSASLFGKPGASYFPALFLACPAPDAAVLISFQSKLQALAAYYTARTDGFGLINLFQRLSGGSDRKKELGISVAAASTISPVPKVRFAHDDTVADKFDLSVRYLTQDAVDFFDRGFPGYHFEDTVLQHRAHTAGNGCRFDFLGGWFLAAGQQLSDLSDHQELLA
jgi:hypothetical protein